MQSYYALMMFHTWICSMKSKVDKWEKDQTHRTPLI